MKRQRGFSLIEALIALVVLSLGLVGVAAMQLKALQSATAGYQRSVATLAAVDAQERLWAELAQGVVCSDMTDNMESNWQEYWFDGSETPIRDSSGTISEEGSCEFKITITLDLVPDDADGDFIYVFRLPN
ncbi:type IV pilus modification PilV family protein [Halomonas llamarensis]|uniref:Prepilin-type N-terminal cleavage/methylation domain-containing protein n=1 Tax=Halomonas llamarensis TaxID=2945104 RepID=A0ABT0SPD7_9GAMM|nr:prepilin-type N-terminal cleavage/methylation domain-containing protein [Halomonas llamarensis]MCL7929665.1 prepilin-type N-terminal cleavage/methylation domain-containing protein [Halomonas llamarensis]